MTVVVHAVESGKFLGRGAADWDCKIDIVSRRMNALRRRIGNEPVSQQHAASQPDGTGLAYDERVVGFVGPSLKRRYRADCRANQSKLRVAAPMCLAGDICRRAVVEFHRRPSQLDCRLDRNDRRATSSARATTAIRR